MAFAAHQGQIVPLAWVLLLGNIFWAIAYDTEYAMVDRDDDLKLGLKSSAILFGRFDVAAVMICHALFLLCMVYVGVKAQCGLGYFAGLVVAACIVAYQYLLIRGRRREDCFRAFTLNNWVGAAIWVGIVAEFMWRIPLFAGAPPAR
jgi:4-hydroxybenzoate polyprenyltransferase